MRKHIYHLAAAVGVAATLALASGPARAALIFTPTTFDGFSAVIDQTTGLGWVSPTIAAAEALQTDSGSHRGGVDQSRQSPGC